MVYNLFLNDNFLQNPLMRPFFTTWQYAQTQQIQLMLTQYQFWQNLSMQTLLASQQFWLPNTSVMFGLGRKLPNIQANTGVSAPFTIPAYMTPVASLSPDTIPNAQTYPTRIQDVTSSATPKTIPHDLPNAPTSPANFNSTSSQTTLNQAVKATTIPSKTASITPQTANPVALTTLTDTAKPAKKPRSPSKAATLAGEVGETIKAKPPISQKNSPPTPIATTAVVPKLPTVAPKNNATINPSPLTEVATTKKRVIDLNHATQAQLLKLDGINSKKAQDIIAYRDKNNGFQTINDLAKVKGIGQSTVDKNRDYLTLSAKK